MNSQTNKTKSAFTFSPFLAILAFTIILRFWNFFEIPFTHDEYSSLRRAEYSSFSELIEKGVSHDTHPPLTQIFYFVWIKLGGTSEWWIKLPFLMMGVISVILVYCIARKWFGTSSALLSSSLMAVLQEPVMHSQSARPYAMGVFFVLASVFALQKVISIEHRKARWLWPLLSAMFLACSALTHHFSMLAAFLFALLLFICNWRSHWKILIVIYAVALVFYLPNISILLKQLEMGGIGSVLSPPGNTFLIDYLYYVFNLSTLMILVVCVFFVASMLRIPELKNKKAFWICIGVFTLSFLLGFVYSKKIAPVLHYRALFFALPFFFMALFAFAKEYSSRINWTIVLIILLTGSSTLFFGRHYYRTFYTDGYSYILQESKRLSTEKSSTVMVCYSQDMLSYQLEKQKLALPNMVNVDSLWTMHDYVDFINAASEDQFVMGYTWHFYRPPVEVFGLLFDKYRHMNEHQDYFNSNLFVFAKDGNSKNAGYVSDSLLSRTIAEEISAIDENNVSSAFFKKELEFGYKLSTAIPNAEIGIPDWLIASMKVKGLDLKNALLVMEVKEGDEVVHYDARNLEQFRTKNDSVFTAFNGLFSPDILQKGHSYTLNAYVWNRGSEFEVIDFKLIRIKGNPIMYCLDQPVESEDLEYLPQLNHE